MKNQLKSVGVKLWPHRRQLTLRGMDRIIVIVIQIPSGLRMKPFNYIQEGEVAAFVVGTCRKMIDEDNSVAFQFNCPKLVCFNILAVSETNILSHATNQLIALNPKLF